MTEEEKCRTEMEERLETEKRSWEIKYEKKVTS